MGEAPSRFAPFGMSRRQRRLRTTGAALLLLVAGMALFGARSPYFRSVASPQVTALAREAIVARRSGAAASPRAEAARRAVQSKLITIYGYWVACFLLTTGVVAVALLDVREIRNELLLARKAIWQRIEEEARAKKERAP
ncbi:MAG: hypothetical protein NT029_05125 [Armatimonadetes bacterium]|nr:hypothetical protein [Armatimonadota bacterium]